MNKHKLCKKCGYINDNLASFCQRCGNKFLINKKPKKSNNIYFYLIILLIPIFIIGGIFGFILLNEETTKIEDFTKIYENNNPTWHKIKTYNGVGDDTLQINTKGSKIKIVSTAMPIKNYADNSLTTILNKGSKTIDMSQMSWNSKSAVATKTRTIEVSNTGSFEIVMSAYELQWWTVEVYEYY